MEQLPVEQEFPECADFEEVRVRESEYVNMNVLHLRTLLTEANLTSVDPSMLSLVPPDVIDALMRYIDEQQVQVLQDVQRAEALERELRENVDKAEALSQKVERLKASVAFLSEKSTAEMNEFRQELRQGAESDKGRARELADVTRKREKAELEIRRTQIEVERLGKIAKRVK